MNKLKKFQLLLCAKSLYYKDNIDFVKDFLKINPEIVNQVFKNKTAIIMAVEQQIKRHKYPKLQNELDFLVMELSSITPLEILNYQNKNGDTVIHLTTKKVCYSVSILDSLKESGASFSLINKKGETPLIKIANTKSLDDLKFIHAYTDPKLIDHRDFIHGDSALMCAVRAKRLANIKFLLEMGASLFVKNNKGETILEFIKSDEYKNKVGKIFYRKLEKIIKSNIENKII